jgi:hypothetical protein
MVARAVLNRPTGYLAGREPLPGVGLEGDALAASLRGLRVP